MGLSVPGYSPVWVLIYLSLAAGWGVESSGRCSAQFRLFIDSNRRATRCAFLSLDWVGLTTGAGRPRMGTRLSPPAVALKYAETRPPGLAGIVLVNAFTSTPLPALATRGLLAAQGPPEWMFQAQPPPEIVARALLGGGGPAAVDLARGLLVEFYPPPRRHHFLSGPSGENGAIFAVCTALCAVPGRPGCAAPTIVGVDVMEARTTDAALCGLCV